MKVRPDRKRTNEWQYALIKIIFVLKQWIHFFWLLLWIFFSFLLSVSVHLFRLFLVDFWSASFSLFFFLLPLANSSKPLSGIYQRLHVHIVLQATIRYNGHVVFFLLLSLFLIPKHSLTFFSFSVSTNSALFVQHRKEIMIKLS